MTIARKLWLGFGVLILIFLLASLTILLSEGSIWGAMEKKGFGPAKTIKKV
jgi:hypothetical protein